MGKRIFIYVFWLLLFCMMSGQVIGQNKSVESHSHTCKTVLALKNNLLYDLALAPNIEVELPLGKRWSLNVEYKCPWWSDSGCNFCYQLLSGTVGEGDTIEIYVDGAGQLKAQVKK